MIIESAFGTFRSVDRCQDLLENEISISIKLLSRRKHELLYNFLVDGCVDCGLQKTQWTNTSRWHGSPNNHRLWKLPTGLQATWIMLLSTLPPDSGTLISKWNATFTLIWKEDFGPLSNSPVLFLHSPGKMLLTMFLFQKWLGSPFQFTPCEALRSVCILRLWFLSCKLSSKLKQKKWCLTLHVMNLKCMKVSLFEISYKKKLSRYSIFFRCTCTSAPWCKYDGTFCLFDKDIEQFYHFPSQL